MKVLDFQQGTDDWLTLRHSMVSGTTLDDVYSEFTITISEIKNILNNHAIDFKGKTLKSDLYALLPSTEREAIESRIPLKDRAWHIAASKLLDADLTDAENITTADRGNRLESEALDLYEKKHGSKIKRGLVLGSQFKYFMLSPDGVSADGQTAVEVKCLGWGKQLKAFITKKIPDDFTGQAVSYFIALPKLQNLTFAFYDPRFYDKKLQYFEIEVARSELADKINRRKDYLKRFDAWIDNITKIFKKLEF